MNRVINNQNTVDFGSPISISSTESENTKRRLGHFSATDSDTDNASSTMTTPKESSRKLVFHNSGETPPGHYSFASWEEHEHKKRRPNADNDDQDPPAAAI